MSDRPLFQNTDEHEAAYAPQQLPVGSEGARDATVDDGNRSTGGPDVIVPGAAVGLGGIGSGGGVAGGPGTGGGISGPQSVNAGIAGAAMRDTQDRDDDGVVEIDENRRG